MGWEGMGWERRGGEGKRGKGGERDGMRGEDEGGQGGRMDGRERQGRGTERHRTKHRYIHTTTLSHPVPNRSYNFGRGLKERVFSKEQHWDLIGICFPPRSGSQGKGDEDRQREASEEKERDTVALRSL